MLSHFGTPTPEKSLTERGEEAQILSFSFSDLESVGSFSSLTFPRFGSWKEDKISRSRTIGHLPRTCEPLQDFKTRVTDDMIESKRVWYLPHHPVFHPKKPDKPRVVFDCAAKCNRLSLNDCILQGPDWTTPLVEVLCRFRLGRVAVTDDIKEMFL